MRCGDYPTEVTTRRVTGTAGPGSRPLKLRTRSLRPTALTTRRSGRGRGIDAGEIAFSSATCRANRSPAKRRAEPPVGAPGRFPQHNAAKQKSTQNQGIIRRFPLEPARLFAGL